MNQKDARAVLPRDHPNAGVDGDSAENVPCLRAFLWQISPINPPPVAGPADAASPLPATGVWITATPNPIPGATGQGKTAIKWHSRGSSDAVYVGENSDAIFANAPDGSIEAPWIDPIIH